MKIENMTWQEYESRISNSVIILPIGSLEQHGPHLPLNVDVIIPTNLAILVAERVNGVVLPAINYGYKSNPTSGGGQAFPGTTSLNGNTLINMVFDIIKETYRHGGKRFLFLNGHYENSAFIDEAVSLFYEQFNPNMKSILLEWWDQVPEETVCEIFKEAGFPGWDTEHAAITETSLMMYFAPELVREDAIRDDESERKPTYKIYPPPNDIIPASGILYKASFASREKGKLLADKIVENLVSIIEKDLVG